MIKKSVMSISKQIAEKYNFMSIDWCYKNQSIYYIWYINSKINILNLDQIHYMVLFLSMYVFELVIHTDLFIVFISAISFVFLALQWYIVFRNNHLFFSFLYSYLSMFGCNKSNIYKYVIILGVIVLVLCIVLVSILDPHLLYHEVFTSPDNPDGPGNSSGGNNPGENPNSGGNGNNPNSGGNGNKPNCGGNGNRHYCVHGTDCNDPSYEAGPRTWLPVEQSNADLKQKRLEFANGLITSEQLDSAQKKFDKAWEVYDKEANDHYTARASNFKGAKNVQILN